MNAAALCLSLLALPGCAGITSNEDTDGSSTGVRYYNSAPFLLAYSDSKGGIVTELFYWPDTTRVLSLDTTAFFAQNKTELTFEDSILITSNTEADATALPKAVITAAKGIATAALSGNVPTAGSEKTVPAPSLYRIHYGADPEDPKNKIWQLVGGEGAVPIKTTYVREVE